MAVVTPDGIVGKVIAAYPTASEVLLITDPAFAAGVISQKNRVHGTLKGQGYSAVKVDYVPIEEKVEPGEWFYTSGDDRIFPKGLPVGEDRGPPGKPYKEILRRPSGLQNGLEEVLIVIEGVHAPIPEAGSPTSQPVHLQEPPPRIGVFDDDPRPRSRQNALTTDADRLVDQYRKIGEAEKHVYGQSAGGAPNFNLHLNRRLAQSIACRWASARTRRRAPPQAAALPKPRCQKSLKRQHEPFRSQFPRRIQRTPAPQKRRFEIHIAAIIGIPLAAILFQVYVPRFFERLSYLELPLLVTVYFSLMRRSPVVGVLFGAGIGLAQDSLSHNPLGMFGIVKTLVGYFAASMSQRFDVQNAWVRLVLSFFFFFFHQFFYWVLGRALLGEALEFDLQTTLVVAVLNALVALPLYHILDKLKITD